MSNKKIISGFCMFFLLLVIVSAECDFTLPLRFDVVENENFQYQINSSGLFFTYAPINFSLSDFSISKSGLVRFTPKDEQDKHTLLVIATSPEGCYEVSPLQINVLRKPKILNYTPDKNVVLNETQNLLFIIKADSTLKYEWYFDRKKQSSTINKYSLLTNYSFAGRHTLIGYVIDDKGLNSSVRWSINIHNQNRGPYLKYPLPSFVITPTRKGLLFNLNDYVFDPDGDNLEFKPYFVKENLSETSSLMDIVISKNGEVSVFPKQSVYLTEHVSIKVSDSSSEIYLEPFDIEIASSEESIEYLFQSPDVDRCSIDMKCSEWSECLFTGIKTRECYDENNCNGENTEILESKECEYGATCKDNIKNQGEEEIDCGGPCKPCPTCFDQIKNQGEENIDCGGPCNPCPNCFDLIKNQNETDIDCGGICEPCSSGNICKKHTDCQSLLCDQGICTKPTCDDNRKNQGEENIDCGGPCIPCATCNDHILNQGEENIDCGGPCKSCTNCYDGIKNQGEIFKDCGGPCECAWFDFITNNLIKIILIIFIIVFLIIFNLYKQNHKSSYLLKMSRIVNFLPIRLKELDKNTITAINKLKQLQYKITSRTSNEINNEYENILSEYFVKVLESEDASSVLVKKSVKTKIKNPYIKKYFLSFYYYTKKDLASSPLYKIEMNQKIDNTIFRLNKIKENA